MNECCVEILVLQHGSPEHGNAQHTDPEHGHTKVLQVRAREHLMWFCGSCAVMLCNRRCRCYRDVLACEGWTVCIQPDAGAGSIARR